MEIVRATTQSACSPQVVRTRCPACRHRATFDKLGTDLDLGLQDNRILVAGQRRCPDPKCHAHLFFIALGEKLLVTYPPETITFDSSGIPPRVLGALQEAVICHANGAFFAAAIMVRKTLEELCHDRQAKGRTLYEQINALRASVILPTQMLDGLDELRMLGNDAAHGESRTYEQVGQEEVEIALEFTREVLKSVYQLEDLLHRLRSHKKRKS